MDSSARSNVRTKIKTLTSVTIILGLFLAGVLTIGLILFLNYEFVRTAPYQRTITFTEICTPADIDNYNRLRAAAGGAITSDEDAEAGENLSLFINELLSRDRHKEDANCVLIGFNYHIEMRNFGQAEAYLSQYERLNSDGLFASGQLSTIITVQQMHFNLEFHRAMFGVPYGQDDDTSQPGGIYIPDTSDSDEANE